MVASAKLKAGSHSTAAPVIKELGSFLCKLYHKINQNDHRTLRCNDLSQSFMPKN